MTQAGRTSSTTLRKQRIKALAQALEAASDIAIVSHISPDGDTLGSALALWQALCLLKKSPKIYCEDPVPHLYRFLPGSEAVTTPNGEEQHELLVVVDCADRARLGSLQFLLDSSKTVGWIDHHINSEGEDYALGVVDVTASSVGEIMLDLVDALSVPLNVEIGECLYTAISTDTGNFCYSNTQGSTHRAVARLMDAGVKAERLAELLYRRRTLSKTKLIGAALSTLEMHKGGKLSIMTLPLSVMHEAGATDEECEGLIDYARDIEGVGMALFLRETQDAVKVSFRSKEQPLNVQQLAARHGGGGHHYASGCTLHGIGLLQAREMLKKEAEAMIEEAEKDA